MRRGGLVAAVVAGALACGELLGGSDDIADPRDAGGDAALELDASSFTTPDGAFGCPNPLLGIADDFAGSSGVPWRVVESSGGDVAVEGGALVAEVRAKPPLEASGFYDLSFDGGASAAQVTYAMRVSGTSPAVQVGCKLIFGRLGANDNINARVVAKNGRLDLELAATGAPGTSVVPLLNGGVPGPAETIDVVMTLFPAPGGGYRVSTTAGIDGGANVETTVIWPGDGGPANGAVRCGILQTTPDAGTAVTVTIDAVSALVCP